MLIGVTVRNMGPQSMPQTVASCAALAEAADLESLWITDHIAIPPDDAQGSGGRYLDPLITLAWIAGATERIKLGTGVLVLPYRSALPTAKQIATLQELAGERLLLGVGIGWMDAEFRALGLNRHRRGKTSDEVLEFLNRCFAANAAHEDVGEAAEDVGKAEDGGKAAEDVGKAEDVGEAAEDVGEAAEDGGKAEDVVKAAEDVVEANGQPFLFKPRPAKPPIYIGGRAPHALERATRYGDGWLPMGLTPERLAVEIETYRELTEAAGKPPGLVTLMRGLPLDDAAQSGDLLAQYEEIGVERLVCGMGYDTVEEFSANIEKLDRIVNR